MCWWTPNSMNYKIRLGTGVRRCTFYLQQVCDLSVWRRWVSWLLAVSAIQPCSKALFGGKYTILLCCGMEMGVRAVKLQPPPPLPTHGNRLPRKSNRNTALQRSQTTVKSSKHKPCFSCFYSRGRIRAGKKCTLECYGTSKKSPIIGHIQT